MTITNTTNTKTDVGNGISTSFSFPFSIALDTELVVTLVTTATPTTRVLQVLVTDYTVIISTGAEGGSVEFIIPPPSGQTVLIERDTGLTQTVDLSAGDRLPSPSLEAALDKNTKQIIAIDDDVTRSFRVTAENTGFDGELAITTSDANAFVAIDSAGTGLATVAIADLTGVTLILPGTTVDQGFALWSGTAGDTLIDNGPTIATAQIADEAVTLAKQAHIDTRKILGRTTAATGDVEVLDFLDDDAFTADDANAVASQQSIKAQIATQVATVTLNLGTPVASTSGTSIDFTISAGAKNIVVNYGSLSTSGTDPILVQLGDAGGIEASGYLGAASALDTAPTVTQFTAGHAITEVQGAANIGHGRIEMTLLDASTFTWAINGVGANSNNDVMHVSASGKSLSAELTTVRITTTGGTDTFDLGKINVAFE